MIDEARRLAYSAGVVYGSADQLISDYLRDGKRELDAQPIQRGTHFAVVEEADLVMIDAAFQSHSYTTTGTEGTRWYLEFAKLARLLKRGIDYDVDDKAARIDLTDAGIDAVEDWFGIDNLYTQINAELVPYLDGALRAKELYRRGEHYALSHNILEFAEILLLDQIDGRILRGRQYNNGLQQALEAKEGVRIRPANVLQSSMDQWAYFRLYRKLTGLSGTVVSATSEFRLLYGLEVCEIPGNRPLNLVQHDDIFFGSDFHRWSIVADLVAEHHATGQPVLVDVSSNERADALSKILSVRDIPHRLLTTRNYTPSEEALADAGRKGAVVVGTNLYRANFDIPLGGRDGTQSDHDDMAALGGLMVIGSERRISRRSDDRLRDLVGHRGDPGECAFMLSQGDALTQRLRWTPTLTDDISLSSSLLNRAFRSVQRALSTLEYEEIRLGLGYSGLFEAHRTAINDLRGKALNGDSIDDLARGYLLDVVNSYLERYVSGHGQRRRDLDGLNKSMIQLLGTRFDRKEIVGGSFADQLMTRSRRRSLATDVHEIAQRCWDGRANELGLDLWFGLERRVLISAIDTNWRGHITDLNDLRQVVGMTRLAGRDPLTEYQNDANSAFEKLTFLIKETFVGNMMNLEIQVVEDQVAEGSGVPVTAASEALLMPHIPTQIGTADEAAET
jgi:preprotein translocase subunit SecA